MTIEGHIENLKAMASDMPSDKCSDWIESLMAGVKALEQEPCTDAVSRQAAIVALDNRMQSLENVDMQIAMGFAKGIINELPPVTAQPKMGKWIYDKKEDSYKCSLCGFPCHKDNLGAIPTMYCANCGSKIIDN